MKALLLLFVAGIALADCPIPKAPTVILQQGSPDRPGSRLLQTWELGNDPRFYASDLPAIPSLHEFLKAVPHSDQVSLLERAIASPVLPKADVANARQMLARRRELIRPVRCLEAFLLAQQTDRMDMRVHPSEFLAFVLRSPDRARLKIHYYTTNEPGVRRLADLLSRVESDVAAGWEMWMNLHNHNFPLGVVAPSSADVGFFRNLVGLREAWITNGFDTAVIPSRDFGKFAKNPAGASPAD